MINVHQWAEARRLHIGEGKSVRAIARELGLARNTVRAALRSEDPPSYGRRSQGSKLDPFKEEIVQLLRTDAGIPAKLRVGDHPAGASPRFGRRSSAPLLDQRANDVGVARVTRGGCPLEPTPPRILHHATDGLVVHLVHPAHRGHGP